MDLSATTLANDYVRLEPFEAHHRTGLIAAAHADLTIFRHMPYPVAREGYTGWFDWLQQQQRDALWIPHAVFNPAGEIVGQTCYLNIRAGDDCVEIGGTWYRPEAQGTTINPAAKLLLLGRAFACGAERVELKTDALNMQSRNAMHKLGCVFEGVMRRQMRRPDGSWRDNAWFSVIRDEWPDLKSRLEQRLAAQQ